MVCHETYRDGAGNWLLPEQVTKGPDGRLVEHRRRQPGRGRPLREDEQVEEERRRPDPDHRDLRRRYRALVHALRQPAGARSGMDRGGRGGRLALHPAAVAPGRRRPRGAERGPGGMERRQWRRCLDAPAPRDPQDHRRRDRGYRALPLQPGGGADLRARQFDRRAGARRQSGGAARDAGDPGPPAGADDAPSGRGAVAASGP